jgi:phage terminase large subunit
MDKDGKKAVIPKDKVKENIGRSPDYSDTLMMREYFDLAPQFAVMVG